MLKGSNLMVEKRWSIIEGENAKLIDDLKERLQVSETIAKLLINRGVDTFEKAKSFFRPSLDDLHDPFLMEDMEVAVSRLSEAIDENEKILVYGDYDVDGTTAVALMYSFLSKKTEQVDFYQPDRYTEGYGISMQAIEWAKDEGIGLIVALDCGIRAIDQIALASSYGIDTIICDHHRPGENLPEAYAILNPKKESCEYPYGELCGCGIGFKLAHALSIYRDEAEEEAFEFLDLVAIAVAADIVPMTGENRILTSFGIKQLEDTPRVGIRTMLELANKTGKLSVSDLVFVIAPRINAAGRMDSARRAVELLISENEEEAKSFSLVVNTLNNERKELDKMITLEALEMIAKDDSSEASVTTVVSSKHWHKGVVGIVASRLIETHYKPTIVLCVSDGVATGSARSVKGFDVYEAIHECADLLEKFGGHKYAAGLSLKEENLDQFKVRFEEAVKKRILPEQLVPEIKIDSTITSDELRQDSASKMFPKLYRIVEQFGPFGPGNSRPVFRLNNVEDPNGWTRVVGDDHLKFSGREIGKQMPLNGIGFGLGNKLDLVKHQDSIDLVFTLDKNEYMGNVSLQLMIKDLK